MILEIVFSHQAKKFVRKNSNLVSADKIADAVELAMRKTIFLEDVSVDLIKLKGG